ncbi:MAG: ABC transporter substrate-binding protein [Lentisphaeria bacterium]|nr:ABC transporter substrate-binding protein [Lentisphaeria bacterium]
MKCPVIRPLCVFALVIAIGIGGSCKKARQRGIDDIKASGQLLMLTNAPFPPYEFYAAGGELVGVDIDIARRIARHLGVELSVGIRPFDELLPALAAGEADMVLAGLTINAERLKQASFSQPYIDAMQYLIILSTANIKVLEDLSGKTIGAQAGSTGEELIATAIADGPLHKTDCQLLALSDPTEAVAKVLNGELDAVVVDDTVALQLTAGHAVLSATPLFSQSGAMLSEQYGVAVSPSNPELLSAVNEVITELKSSGELSAMLKKYEAMTSQPPTAPGRVGQ